MRFPIDFRRFTGRLCRRFGPGSQKFTKKLEFPQFEPAGKGGTGTCAEPGSDAEPISSQPEQFQQIVSEPSSDAQPIQLDVGQPQSVDADAEQLQQNVDKQIDAEPVQFDICQSQSQPVNADPEQFQQVIDQQSAYAEPIQHNYLEPVGTEPQ